jgi:hypothetical protein
MRTSYPRKLKGRGLSQDPRQKGDVKMDFNRA